MADSHVKLLDCTLREAPLDGNLWGEMSIKKMIHGLEKANLDMIEVGFLKDGHHVVGSTSFSRVEEIEPYLCNRKSNVLYVALVDYGRFDISNLSNNNGKSIDAIRICFKHNEINNVLKYAKSIKEKGYMISIQHVDTLGYSDDEIIDFIMQINELKPYAYSVVDTFGAMYEDDVLRLAHMIDEYLDDDIVLGFHGHNNLMLANANAQKFIQEIGNHRRVIVDSSLYGCGRGAGNAHTELLAQYLVSKKNAEYDINELLDLIDTVITAAREKTTWGYSIPYFIAGVHNAHTFNVKQLLKRHNLKSKDLRGIIGMLNETQKKVYDYALLEKLYVEYFDNKVDDHENVSRLERAFINRKILLLAPGKTVQEKKQDIQEFILNNSPIVIAVNNLIEGYTLDFIFYSGAVRYQNLQYQDYRSAGSPQLIVSSNIKSKAEGNEMIVDYRSLVKFGWINIDSSAILLIRLLQRCGVNDIYIAGMDGYKRDCHPFYSNELDTGLDEKTREEHMRDNISMIKDMKSSNKELQLHFITPSLYANMI